MAHAQLARKGHCQLERDQHDLVGSCKLGEFILSSIFGLNSEPQLAAALSPCTSFAQVEPGISVSSRKMTGKRMRVALELEAVIIARWLSSV
jgi:hypothetical protein